MKLKDLFTTLLIISISFLANAQEPHLKFMGIPINGTITQFQSKLIKKGLRVSKYSKSLDKGIRAYEGHFSGRKAMIATYYNPSTKGVFSVRVLFDENSFNSNESAFDVYDYYKELITTKYSEVSQEDTEDKASDDSRRHYAIYVFQDASMKSILGTIRLQVVESDDYYNTYFVTIDYIDSLNSFISGFNDYMNDMNDL